jgi:acyl carrier protein
MTTRDHTRIMRDLAEVVREVFADPTLEVDEATTALDIPGWDSLSHTILILAVEERFGVRLGRDVELADVGELARHLATLPAHPAPRA